MLVFSKRIATKNTVTINVAKDRFAKIKYSDNVYLNDLFKERKMLQKIFDFDKLNFGTGTSQ